jgi:hypothetical protein
MSTGRRTLVCLALFGLLLSSGCATLDIPWVNQMPEAGRRNPVVQIVCMWEPSEGRDPQGAPCRGFAGQILFLGNRGGTPVKVDGDVSVYVFDDLGAEEEQATPIHQFNFDAGAWNRHLQKGSLGPAYYCFIPYTRPGNTAANCTLRLKFTPKEGQMLTSDASHIAMRGKSRTPEVAEEYASQHPQAFHTSRRDETRLPRTTTIPLDSRGRYQPAEAEEENGVMPASYSTEDRAQQILDDFRRDQEAASRRGPVDSRTSASPRMKLNGATAEVVADRDTEIPETSSTSAAAKTADFLSNHPLASGVDTPPTQRHPLRESAPREPTSRVQAATVDRWLPANDADSSTSNPEDQDLDRHTSAVNR